MSVKEKPQKPVNASQQRRVRVRPRKPKVYDTTSPKALEVMSKMKPGQKIEYHKAKNGVLVPDRVIPAKPTSDKPMMELQQLILNHGDAFFEACRLSPTDSKWYTLGIMMQASEWRRYTLAQKVRIINERSRENVSLRELSEFYHNANRDYAVIEVAATHPQRMKDTIIEAARHQVVCHECHGEKFKEYDEWTEDGRDEDGHPLYIKERVVDNCKVCNGEGLVWMAGDRDAKDELLNVMGYNNKQGQTNVNVGVNVNNSNGYKGIEDTSDEVSRILNVTPEPTTNTQPVSEPVTVVESSEVSDGVHN